MATERFMQQHYGANGFVAKGAIQYAVVKLRKEGEEVSAYINIPGAVVAATGDSMKDALVMLADALDENDVPFWSVEEPHA